MARRCILLVVLCVCVSMSTAVATAQRQGKGSVRFRDGAALSDKILVRLSQVAPPEANARYEGWLVSDDGSVWTSIGILTPSANGAINLDWTSPSGENLLARYSRFAITAEPANDTNPAHSAIVVLGGQIAADMLEPVRQLLVQGSDTPLPNRQGIAVGLRNAAQLVRTAARDAQRGAERDRPDDLGKANESTLNLVEGVNSGLFGDLNGDGVIADGGDPYGVLRYAVAAQQLVRITQSSTSATEETKLFANNAITSAYNVVNWSTQIRDFALLIKPTTPLSDSLIIYGNINFLANQVLAGVDVNGNGSIDEDLGEGGARGVYTSVQDMARIDVGPVTSTGFIRPAPPAASDAGTAPASSQPEQAPAPVPSELPNTGAADFLQTLLVISAVLLIAAGRVSLLFVRRERR
jgi:hypothetical protein